MYALDVVRRYQLVSSQIDKRELVLILSELEAILMRSPTGPIVEFGCFIGTTSLFIRRLLNKYDACNEFHVYDSFAGLPDKSGRDSSPAGEQFQAGVLAASKRDFIRQFRRSNLKVPTIHKSWFKDLRFADIPDGIIFAFLDGDYYESIRDSLNLISPKLAPGSVIIVDDYVNESLPGVQQAVDEWCNNRKLSARTQSSLAIIHFSGLI